MNDLGLVVGVISIAAVFIGWTVWELLANLLRRQRETIRQEATTNLEDMFIFVDPAQMFYWNVGALFVLPPLLWLMFGNPVIAVAVAVGLIVMPKWLVGHLRKSRFSTFEKQLPDAMLMVSGSMRAGAGLNVALESMVAESKPPVSQEFELLLREARVGVDFDTALKHMEARLPIQDFVMVVSAMRISREVGGNLADILESIADTLRKKHVMEGKINSLTAQGKIQGVVMTGLPLFLMLVLWKMEPQAMDPLFNTWMGWAVLAVIAVMEGLGYFFISKIVSIDV
ncbi:MAG: type II secretion system F family protein [Sulfuritalea sp.]|nr:type II secretion system F family protein [Sulfuritalea sp.]